MAPQESSSVIYEADNFFSQVPVDRTWVNSFTLTYNPTGTIDSHRLSFEIPRLSSGNCIFLSDLLLSMRVSLVDFEGKKPEDNANVAPIEAFPQTMFESVRCSLNDTDCSSSDAGGYPLRSFTSFALDYGTNDRHSTLDLFGYFPDTGHLTQSNEVLASGYTQRRMLFGKFYAPTEHGEGEPIKHQLLHVKNRQQPHEGVRVPVFGDAGDDDPDFKYDGNSVGVYSKIFTDVASMEQPMISGVGCRLDMTLNEPDFYMFCKDSNAAAKKYRLKIDSAVLIVPCKTLNPGLALDLERRLAEKPIMYRMRRMENKKVTISAGQQSYLTDSLTMSSVNPDRIVILLIREDYWKGGYGANPLDSSLEVKKGTDTACLSSVALSVNGVPLDTDPADTPQQLMTRGYKNLLLHLGRLLAPGSGCSLTMEDFGYGHTMLCYDLTADARAAMEGVRHPPKEGTLRLHVQFDEVLPVPVNLFILGEMHAGCIVDKNRSVTFQFNA